MKKKKLSGSENILLHVLWSVEKPLSIAQIIEYLNERNISWAYTTVATMLKRMDEKGLVATKKIGRAFFYEPLITEQETENNAISFVNRYFQGSLNNFLAAFSKEKTLTPNEIEELKDWVKQFDDDDK